MHEAALAQAALPAAVSVLRLPLRPYALGHELTLIRRANPLLTLTADDFRSLPDDDRRRALIEAAEVCAQTWAQNGWSPTTKAEARRARRNEARWYSALLTADWDADTETFLKYREAGQACFPAELPRGPHVGEARYLGAPELLNLYQFVMAHIPSSERAVYSLPGALNSQPLGLVGWLRLVVRRAVDVSAWDYPLSLARMQKQAFDEMEGKLEIYNYRHFAHDKAVMELKAKLAEQTAAKEAAHD